MTIKTTNKFSPEVRARAVRMVLDHEKDHPSALGSCGVDRDEDRVRRPDAARVGEEGRGRQRHTAVLGKRRRVVKAGAFLRLKQDLAPFLPAPGSTRQVERDAAISDTSTYSVTWTDSEGRRATATHRSGCTGGPGEALDAILHDMPEWLGIGAWTKQTTRPGSTRG